MFQQISAVNCHHHHSVCQMNTKNQITLMDIGLIIDQRPLQGGLKE
jgi:hypothetical protein